jgi:hypothetical protein
MTEVIQLHRPTPTPIAEIWRSGDIVRDAQNPDDRGLWFYAPEGGHKFSWMVLYVDEGGDLDYLGDRVGRDELPERLSLIVRDGQPTDRQTAMALMDENEQLRKQLAGTQKQLDCITERIAGLAENVADAQQDITMTLTEVDPPRGDE